MSLPRTPAARARKRTTDRAWRERTLHPIPRDPTVPATLSLHRRKVLERDLDHSCAIEILAAEARRTEEFRAIGLAHFPDYNEIPIGRTP